jgi:hypothetical protein
VEPVVRQPPVSIVYVSPVMTSTRGRPHCQSLGLCRSLDHCCDLDLTCRSVWVLGALSSRSVISATTIRPPRLPTRGILVGLLVSPPTIRQRARTTLLSRLSQRPVFRCVPRAAIHQRRDCLTATDGLLRLFFSSHMCGTRRGGLCHVSYMKCTASQISASHNTQALPRPSNTGALLRLGTDARVYAASDIVFQSNTPVGKFPASGQF